MLLSRTLYRSVLVAMGLIMVSSVTASVSAEPSLERQKELIHLVKQDCGACHGMTLKGGLGPSLLPESLRNKSNEVLKQTILNGRPPTPMPPWRKFFSEDEVDWLVKLLRRGIG